MTEQYVHALLCQMISKKEVYFGAALRDDHFPAGAARELYRQVAKLYEDAREVDTFLLRSVCEPYVYEWFIENVREAVPSVANWKYYRDELMRAYQQRRYLEILEEGKGRSNEFGIVEWTMRELSRVDDAGGGELWHQSEIIGEYVEEVERRWKTNTDIPGIPTGLATLDHMILGLQPRRMILIGARPNDGKTALMTTLAANIARTGRKVGIISLESSRWELTERIVANLANVENTTLATGRLDDRDRARLAEATQRIHSKEWGVMISDNPYLSIDGMRARIREMVVAHGASVIFIDYMQRIRQTDNAKPYRLHIAECSYEVKSLAEDLNVPIVALAQLGRSAEGGKPMLSHFKESGQLEQDADIGVLIWPSENGMALIVAKNRDGRKGMVPVNFAGQFMRFSGRED